MSVARPSALVLAALVVVGCSSSPSSETDTASATASVATSSAAPAGSDLQSDIAELEDYDLTMEDLEKYVTATINIVRVARENPGAEGGGEDESAGGGEDPNSLEGMEAQIEGNAVMRKAVEDAGLDAREYATISFAYMGASMAAGMMKSAGLSADSVGKAMKVNPDNVTFVANNEAAIARLMQRLKGGQ